MKPIVLALLLCSAAFSPAAVYAETASTADKTAATGPIRTQKDLQDVFNKVAGDVSKVLEERRKEKPDLAGMVVYEFTVEADGKLSECKVASSTVKDAKVEDGVLAIFKKLEFKKANRPEKMTFRFPVEITKDSPKDAAKKTAI